jgi:hypothetical protein
MAGWVEVAKVWRWVEEEGSVGGSEMGRGDADGGEERTKHIVTGGQLRSSKS